MTNHHPSDTSAAMHAPTGLRAQIHHLLPRHALFHVRITIHQLASVPLVHGEFGVRWKFKNTHKLKGKGKGKALEHNGHDLHEHYELEHEHDDDRDSFGSDDISAETRPSAASQSHSSHSNSTASSSALGLTDDSQASTSARGQTPWLPLREHSVTWDQPLAAVVQMSIDRDTHRLLPHPFKLTVMQRVIAHDPDAPHNPRLGSVELDLAEYADSVPLTVPSKGVVTRRYLLRDSKTNATLRLSVRVEPVNTSLPFTAPPLPNGEILAGVTTFLTAHDDVYRTRPRALDLYAPVATASPVSTSKSSFRGKDSSQSQLQPFDIRALPRAYGPRPTESLIEALFNPAPVREERLVSPFTKLVTPESGNTFPSSTSFASATGTSSRPSTSASSRSVDRSSANVSVHSSPGNNSLAPHGHSRSPSLTPSVVPSISPSMSSSTQVSANTGTGANTPEVHSSHHWWKRNRDRDGSRSSSRAGTVVAA